MHSLSAGAVEDADCNSSEGKVQPIRPPAGHG